jgi:hypothetical protein
MNFIGNFKFCGNPQAAQNRLNMLNKQFATNPRQRYSTALAGIYVILLSQHKDEKTGDFFWGLRFMTTSYKKGCALDKKSIKGSKEIIKFLKTLDEPLLLNAIKNKMK